MKNNFYKKLLSIILTAMMILATIPFSCIAVIAENAEVTVLYASQISNNTHLTLNSDTELIMDKELYIKSITGKYNITITGSETLNITNAERTIEVNEFICSAPIRVMSTSETYEEAAISVDYFEASGSELVLYGNYPLLSKDVNITAKDVNIRALKSFGIDASGFIHIKAETVVVNSVKSALKARNDIRLVATRYAEINSNGNGIETTGSFKYEHANVYLGGRITINAELNGIVTLNGSIYADPAYNISALEQLYITASTPINMVGIVNLKCPDVKLTATGKNNTGINANSVYLEGVYNIKTNGGCGVKASSSIEFCKGYYIISGAEGGYAAVSASVEDNGNININGELTVCVPESATYDGLSIYDSNGNPAKEVEIYGIMDSMEIEMYKPVAGMKAVSDIRALVGALPLPSNYRLSEIKWYENGNRMTENMVFTAGNTYSAEVVIYTTNYLRFPSGYMGKVNGQSVSTGLSNNNMTIHLRPDFGTCPIAIEEVALNIAAPVENKKPATVVTDSSSAYYVPANSVVWEVFSSQTQTYIPMSTTSTFIGGRQYYVSFDVVANSGYAFPVELVNSNEINSCVTATVNGKPAYVYAVEEASTSKIRVSMNFGECNDTIIENISIEVTPPKAGEHPDYTARVLGTGYSIDTSRNSFEDAYWVNQKWYYVKNGVSWWDVTDGRYDYVYDKDVFLPDHKYQCKVYVKTDAGYEFVMNVYTEPETFPSVTVNGKIGYPTTEGSGLQFEQKVKHAFNCSMQSLSEVGVIELSQPLAGGTPDYIATTFAPHLYDIKSITWYDALGEELPANATFIAGMVYRVAVKIQPIEVQGKKVASFNSDAKASLNGNQLDMISYNNANKEDVEELFSHAYYEDYQSIYLYYTFKPAPRPATGDINGDIPVESVSISPSDPTMEPGSTLMLTAIVSPTNHTENGSIVWSKVSGSDNITIDPVTGRVTVSDSATSGETATIRAAFGDKYGDCVITVSNFMYSVFGTVTSEGSETDDVTIQLIEGGMTEVSYETIVLGNNVNYSIDHVPAGVYTLRVMKEGHETCEYTITVGPDNVRKDVVLLVKEFDASLSVNGSKEAINLTVGGNVTLVPTVTGGKSPYTYQYLMENVSTGKTMTLKDYSSATSYTGALTSVGTKIFTVKVKDSEGTVVTTNSVTVNVSQGTSALTGSLKVNGSTSQISLTKGSSVTLEPKATGGTAPYTYQYLMKNESTGKTITLKDYSSAASYTGPLTSEGTKIFTVNVRDSKGTVVATNSVTVVVAADASALACSLKVNDETGTINLSKGGSVKLVPTATGGTAPYTYQYMMKNVSTGKSITLKAYSSATSYTGTITSYGTKIFTVKVKDGTGKVVTSNEVTVVTADASALACSLKVNGSTGTINLAKGGSVKLVPTATGGTAPYTYQYMMKNVSTGKTITLKNYSSATSYTGPLTSTGTKIFTVNVKDSKGTVVASNSVTVVVTEETSALTGSLKVNGSTGTINLAKGGSVKLVPTVTGGTAPYTYQYVMKNVSTGKTMTLKNYSNANSYTGPLTSTGTKIFTVNVKDSKGTVVATNSVTVVVK